MIEDDYLFCRYNNFLETVFTNTWLCWIRFLSAHWLLTCKDIENAAHILPFTAADCMVSE